MCKNPPEKPKIRALQHAAEEFFSDPLQLALHEKRVDQEQDPDASSFSRSISFGNQLGNTHFIIAYPFSDLSQGCNS